MSRARSEARARREPPASRARTRFATVIGWIAGATCAGSATLVGCIDLFHSTSDIVTACATDPSALGCLTDGGSSAEPHLDFCAWSSDEAKNMAARACAWLGACEGPIGRNAFGACTVEARLAFDCAANPNHPAAGDARSRWECLAQHVDAGTCSAITDCLTLAPSPLVCRSAGFTGCGGDAGDLRLDCPQVDASPSIEDCTLWGLGCVGDSGAATCGTPSCAQTEATCLPEGSHGLTRIQWCEPGTPASGIDCYGNGAGGCGGFPTADAASWVACLPSDAGPACAPSPAATCEGGVASSCITGVRESIDCASLLDTHDGGACLSGAISPPFDWTSACTLSTPCPPDSCSSDAGELLGCARGATFSVDCSSVGLGPCHLVATDEDAGARAICTPPASP